MDIFDMSYQPHPLIVIVLAVYEHPKRISVITNAIRGNYSIELPFVQTFVPKANKFSRTRVPKIYCHERMFVLYYSQKAEQTFGRVLRMPKYTTYKSIYEMDTSHHDSQVEPVFSVSSLLHKLGLSKERMNRTQVARFRLLLFVVIGLFAGTGVVHAFQNDKVAVETKRVIVSPGDTLWSIAESYKPADADTRIFVRGIQQKNGLNSSEIHAGDELILPNF
ncbi:hypothetical protein B9G55_04570 [Saccharibacillus sp. O16]|nr:hypothetical protein B9G55_04570 [Saccharibacillus sp. O16]